MGERTVEFVGTRAEGFVGRVGANAIDLCFRCQGVELRKICTSFDE